MTLVSDPNQKTIDDISLKPTESYPFNIYCKIVKKHTFRLQPGASMTHKFVHKPKALINRGYWGYRYAKSLNAFASGNPVTASNTRNIGLKDITSGCLFKVWGSITGTSASGAANHNQVVNLTGKLMFREQFDCRWCAMDQKFTYQFKTDTDLFTPTADQAKKLEVPTKTSIKSAMEVDQDTSNNETQGTGASSSNAQGNANT